MRISVLNEYTRLLFKELGYRMTVDENEVLKLEDWEVKQNQGKIMKRWMAEYKRKHRV